MLHPSLTGLPQDEGELEEVLFPERPGKLPVLLRTYMDIHRRNPSQAEKFLKVADDSHLPVQITVNLNTDHGPVNSEMDVSTFLCDSFGGLRNMFRVYSSCSFVSKLLFNLNEKTGDSISRSTKPRWRPDMLLIASGCTFLVGVDKCSSIISALNDLQGKLMPMSALSYGEVQFILGYVAVGLEFQWLYIDRRSQIKVAGPTLDLAIDLGHCQFLLSVGYAYQLISKMVGIVLGVPGHYPMFSEVVERDKVLCFYSDSIHKSIKNFKKICVCLGTSLDVILQAYDVGERKGCNSLPCLCWATLSRSRPKLIDRAKVVGCIGIYIVEISPLGYTSQLRFE